MLLGKEKASERSTQIILLLVLLGAITGCHTPEKKVAERTDQLRIQWLTNVQYQIALPDQIVDWPTAVEIMEAHNLKLRQARIEITNAHESVVQVFKDLMPTLNMRAGISKRLVDIEHISPDDITFSADSFFNVPGVVNFRARWYVAKLYEIRAYTAYELARREQMVDLYGLFFSAEEVRDERERIATQRATALAMMQVDPFSGRMLLTELETRDLAQARLEKDLQDHASDVLGSRDYHWSFSTNGLPDLRYQEVPLPLTDTNRVAQVQLRLVALELEAARAQLLGIKLRYWPELNIFVTGPPVYAVSAGETHWWDAEQVRASADVFWTVDTRGTVARSLRQTKRAQDLQKERLRLEALALMNKLAFTQQLIQSVQQQLSRVEAQLALLLAIPPVQDYASLDKYSTDYHTLSQQRLQLKRELSELNALFWFVDEAAWQDSKNTMLQTG